MIPPQVPQMFAELLECALPAFTDDRIRALQDWRRKWVKEVHTATTYQREILGLHSDADGLIEYEQRRLHLAVGELIGKEKWSVLEQDYNPTPEDGPNPWRREDRLTVYVLGQP